MRLHMRRLVSRPQARSLPDVDATDAFTREECGADGFNDHQTFEVTTEFLRAHGAPTGATTILHNTALTHIIGSPHNGSPLS